MFAQKDLSRSELHSPATRTFVLALCLIAVTPLAAFAAGHLQIVSARMASVEAQNEAAFLAIPSSAGASTTSLALDAVYHYSGTPGDHRLAIYMRDQLQRDGLVKAAASAHLTLDPALGYALRAAQRLDIPKSAMPLRPESSAQSTRACAQLPPTSTPSLLP